MSAWPSRQLLTIVGAAVLSAALSAQPQFRASVNVATVDVGNGIERMLPSLAAVDRLGFVTTSGRSPSIHPSADHAAVLTAVKRVSGQRADEIGPFFIGVGEALAMQRGVRSVVKEVRDRECGTGRAT